MYERIILWGLPLVKEFPTFTFIGFYTWDLTARPRNLFFLIIRPGVIPRDRNRKWMKTPTSSSLKKINTLVGHSFSLVRTGHVNRRSGITIALWKKKYQRLWWFLNRLLLIDRSLTLSTGSWDRETARGKERTLLTNGLFLFFNGRWQCSFSKRML